MIQVYYSEELVTVPVAMIEGKCEVRLKDDVPNSNLPVVVEHVFYCEHLFDPVTGALKQVRLLKFTLFYFQLLRLFSLINLFISLIELILHGLGPASSQC